MTIRLLRELALSYAAFALERPHLYHTMHTAQLWREVTHRRPDRSVLSAMSAEKATFWMNRAIKASTEAFDEFVGTMRDAQKTGATRPSIHAEDAAQCLTALVDGFLFQVLEDHVGAELPAKRQLSRLGRLIDLTLGGVSRQPGDRGR